MGHSQSLVAFQVYGKATFRQDTEIPQQEAYMLWGRDIFADTRGLFSVWWSKWSEPGGWAAIFMWPGNLQRVGG